jgi:hypothetical protein
VFPRGRRRRVRSETPTSASEPANVAGNREDAGGEEIEVRLRLRNRVAADRGSQRDRKHDSDREPAVDERDRRGAPAAGPEQRAGSEERRRQEPAEQVVRAKGAIVPPCGGSPREGGGAERVRPEAGRPAEKLWRPRLPPPIQEQAREAEREQRGAEREDRFHAASLFSGTP